LQCITYVYGMAPRQPDWTYGRFRVSRPFCILSLYSRCDGVISCFGEPAAAPAGARQGPACRRQPATLDTLCRTACGTRGRMSAGRRPKRGSRGRARGIRRRRALPGRRARADVRRGRCAIACTCSKRSASAGCLVLRGDRTRWRLLRESVDGAADAGAAASRGDGQRRPASAESCRHRFGRASAYYDRVKSEFDGLVEQRGGF